MIQLTLRPYQSSDGEKIAAWFADERAFTLWSAGRYPRYPVTGEDITAYYAAARDGRYFPYTAVDEDGIPVGHLLLRYPDNDRTHVRFGFIVVDSSRRGCGLGRAMLSRALDLAFGQMQAKRVTLGVFAENAPARACYHALGFTETGETELYPLLGEDWICIEMQKEAVCPEPTTHLR